MASQDKEPVLEHGFLGAQPRFADEMKMKTDSHKSAKFKVISDNEVKIKFKTDKPIKQVTKLTQCSTGSELPDYVFVQRKNNDQIEFRVGFPEDGYYKFQVFALLESDSSENLPNVFNYLIEVRHIRKPARPFVKTYTKFYKDCCDLEEPLVLNCDTPKLEKVRFEVTVPGAHKVAVHCVEEWFHLEKKGGDRWVGNADLSRYKGKNSKVTLNANYDSNSNSFSVLLEYTI